MCFHVYEEFISLAVVYSTTNCQKASVACISHAEIGTFTLVFSAQNVVMERSSFCCFWSGFSTTRQLQVVFYAFRCGRRIMISSLYISPYLLTSVVRYVKALHADGTVGDLLCDGRVRWKTLYCSGLLPIPLLLSHVLRSHLIWISGFLVTVFLYVRVNILLPLDQGSFPHRSFFLLFLSRLYRM